MRRTRLVILGRETTRGQRDGVTEFYVPTLLQCKDKRDADDMNVILRAAGYFPSFHWPKEMMDFVQGVKEEVKKKGFPEDRHYFRVRPEVRDGEVMIKVDVKSREEGARFSLKGLWTCPPLKCPLWDKVQGLFTPRWTPRN